MIAVSPGRIALSSTAILILLLLCMPLIVLFGVSLNSEAQAVFPPQGLSLRWYARAFERRDFVDALPFSLGLAAFAATVSLVVGVMASLGISRYEFAGRELLLTLFLSPMIVPQVVIGLAFLTTFAMINLKSSVPALALLHTLLALPFVVRIVTSALMRLDLSVEEAARTLGCTPVRAFLSVTAPSIRPSLISAGVFAFAASFENFTASQFLIWDRPTLPVAIFNYIETENDPTAAAVSSLLVLFAAAVVVAFHRSISVGIHDRR